MTVKPRRAALSAFLKARRAAIAPKSIGLARGARRLTPGLRREELAANAGVGLTWYTWLEQGRDITPSPATLYRIAKALRLSEADREYMFALVDPAPPDSIQIAFEPTCAVAGVLRAFQGPAAVLDPTLELVASNPIAEHLFGFEQGTSAFSRNQLWQLFNNPQRRALYEDVRASMQNFPGAPAQGFAPSGATDQLAPRLTDVRSDQAKRAFSLTSPPPLRPLETLG